MGVGGPARRRLADEVQLALLAVWVPLGIEGKTAIAAARAPLGDAGGARFFR